MNRLLEKLCFKDRMQYAWEQVLSTAKKVAPYVLAGVPIYADIFGTIPIAEALLARGALLGVFTAICTAGIVAAGYVFNIISDLLV